MEAITILAGERLHTEMPPNVIEHMVAPFDRPFRLRTGVPATGVPGGAPTRTLLVALTARVRNGGVEDLQLFCGNIVPCTEVG